MNRPGSIVAAVLAGVLLALSSAIAPAHGAAPTTGQVAGSIRDHGRPVAGATVEAVDPDAAGPLGGAVWPKAITDAAGRFTIADVPPGDYLLRTTLPGGWMVQFYPQTQDFANAAVPFTVTAGKTARVDDNVVPHASVSGRVVTNRGAPAGGAWVSAGYGRSGAEVLADAQGRYLVDYLQPGDLSMQAARAARAPRQWVAGPNIGVIVPLVVDQRAHVDITLWPVGRITGKYLGPQGPLAGGVTAYINGQVGGSAQIAADDGTYTLWLWPGDYKLFFSAAANRHQWATAKTTEAEARIFTVREDAVLRYDEHALPTGKVSGRVLAYDGAPLDAPTTVFFYPPGSYPPSSQTTTDSAGYWSIEVPPDTYTVKFLAAGHLQWAHDKDSAETADPVVVAPGSTTTLPDELYRSSTSLVVNATLDGNPVDAFCATLETPDADQSCTETGTVYFPSTTPVGKHVVTAVVDGHPPATATVTLADQEPTSSPWR